MTYEDIIYNETRFTYINVNIKIKNMHYIYIPGGDSSWREFLTLPNILKEYNPNLRGYSTGTGEWLSKNSRLNVAFPVASDQDAYKQAKVSYI